MLDKRFNSFESEFDSIYVAYIPIPGTDLLGYKRAFYHTAIAHCNQKTGVTKNIFEANPEKFTRGLELIDYKAYGNLIKRNKNHFFLKEDLSNAVHFDELVDSNKSGTLLLSQLIEGSNRYDNSIKYHPIPSMSRKLIPYGNSNSFVGSLLRSAGYSYKPSRYVPGYDTELF